MTPEQIHLVRASWQQVRPIADQAAELFYNRLFEIAPETRSLFKGDMKAQGHNLINMINTAVEGLGNLDRLVPIVRELGRRHTGYGVSETHYHRVGEALIWTLEQGLGDGFTSDVKSAWCTTYGLLADTMKAGAANRDPVQTHHHIYTKKLF